jgi:hypothetical protein
MYIFKTRPFDLSIGSISLWIQVSWGLALRAIKRRINK